MPDGHYYRMPLSPEDRDRLADLLTAVPTSTVTRYAWNTPQGQAVVKAVRAVQVDGKVPLTLIAKALGVSCSTLDGALTAYVRGSNTNTRRRRREAGPQ